jgi:hypothetical protein
MKFARLDLFTVLGIHELPFTPYVHISNDTNSNQHACAIDPSSSNPAIKLMSGQ